MPVYYVRPCCCCVLTHPCTPGHDVNDVPQVVDVFGGELAMVGLLSASSACAPGPALAGSDGDGEVSELMRDSSLPALRCEATWCAACHAA